MAFTRSEVLQLARNMPHPRCFHHPARLQGGFTFAELATAVGIVGVVVMVALQSFRSHRDTARQHEAAAEIAKMAASLKMRWQDERRYPDSLDAAHFGQRIDPWGRPYVYYNIEANGPEGARKDMSLQPLNTDFDLYSLGPNGRSRDEISHRDSRDDVVRARDGGYVGPVAPLIQP